MISSFPQKPRDCLRAPLPVFDRNISLDNVCPTSSYCRRLMDSLGQSTDATIPFLHVNMISLLV